MLTRQDLKLALCFFRLYSWLPYFPIEFSPPDFLTFKPVKSSDTKGKFWAWAIVFVAHCFHCCFLCVRLLQSVLQRKYFQPTHFPIHAIQASLGSISAYYNYLMFYTYPDITAGIFNLIHKDLVRNPTDARPLLRRWKDFSMQELLITAFPLLLLEAHLVTMAIIILDRENRIQLVYSILAGTDYQTSYTFAILYGLEVFIFLMAIATASFGIFLQLSFFSKVLQILESQGFRKAFGTIRYVRTSGSDAIRESYKTYRELQLLVQLFNQSQSEVLYLIKLYCMGGAIMFLFFGIRYVDNLALSAFNLVIGLFAITSFVLLYDRAFDIPLKLERVKEDSLLNYRLALGGTRSMFLRKEAFEGDDDGEEESSKNPSESMAQIRLWKMRMDSIPNVGIQVGSFHSFERTSTPRYLDFVGSTVASLLISIK